MKSPCCNAAVQFMGGRDKDRRAYCCDRCSKPFTTIEVVLPPERSLAGAALSNARRAIKAHYARK